MEKFKESICSACGENCCRNFYIVLLEVKDRDWVRWLSYHKGVTIKKKQGNAIEVWFDYPCKHLQKDGSCAIYEKRPKICREFMCAKLESQDNERKVRKQNWWLG